MVNYEKRPSASAGQPAVNLNKVTLTKQSPSISLTKRGSASGQMRVNLNWNAQPAGTSGWKGMLRSNTSLDLDLGCLWELADGSKGVIQALGSQFGALDQPPFISLDGDDRSGSNVGGENLLINLSQVNWFRRILVFAYIYEGAPSWDKAQGVVTLFPSSGPQIEIHLDENAGGARFCAIALLQNMGNDLSVRREVQYIQGSQATVDQAYGWGLQWTGARK